MSPRRSLTTNVLPSRILIVSAVMVPSIKPVGGANPRSANPPALRTAFEPDRRSSRRDVVIVTRGSTPRDARPTRPATMAASPERRTVRYGAMDTPSVALSSDERELVERLQRGDEEAFMTLVERLQPQMLRVARMYVSNRAAAEEVVQDAWLAVLRGIDRFEGRSSLRTWIFRIVANLAKTRGQREARSVPFSSLSDDSDEGVLDPAWFQGSNDRHPGGWLAF